MQFKRQEFDPTPTIYMYRGDYTLKKDTLRGIGEKKTLKHTMAFGDLLVSHDESEDILEDEIALTILHVNKKQKREKERISACKKETSAMGGQGSLITASNFSLGKYRDQTSWGSLFDFKSFQ